MYWRIFRKSFRSSSGNLFSSAYLKATATMPDWVSFKSSILENSTGPNSTTVARSRAPGSSESVSSSTGLPPASKGIPMASWRSSILGCPSLATAMPDKSPLMSISKLGTPSRLSCSAMICSVFVLPVPVAPAIRPWRFRVPRGMRTRASVRVSSPSMAPPRIKLGPLKV